MSIEAEDRTLVVGGTSGLGSNLASRLYSLGHNVVVTGRGNHKSSFQSYMLNVRHDNVQLAFELDRLVDELPEISTLIYSAACGEQGLISEHADEDIQSQIAVNITAPAMLLARILKKQGKMRCFTAITSTSQIKAHKNEPLYCAGKSALAMLARSVALSGQISFVRVVGPTGMKTSFWHGIRHIDTSKMLSSDWVAEQTVTLMQAEDSYIEALVLRDPNHVDILSNDANAIVRAQVIATGVDSVEALEDLKAHTGGE